MKITSEKKAAAARANGARSRGPITATGKSRSSRNAITHGILTKSILLNEDDARTYLAIVQSYCARLKPQDDTELALVHELVATSWRLRRLQHFEQQAPAPTEVTPLDRYFVNLTGTYSRLLHALIDDRAHTLRVPNKPITPLVCNKSSASEPKAKSTTTPGRTGGAQ